MKQWDVDIINRLTVINLKVSYNLFFGDKLLRTTSSNHIADITLLLASLQVQHKNMKNLIMATPVSKISYYSDAKDSPVWLEGNNLL